MTKYAAKIGGTTANLKEGDIFTLRQLMHGMMLPSGNDAAYQIAEFFGQVLKERKYGSSGVISGVEDNDMVPGPRGIPVTSQFSQQNGNCSHYIRYFLLEMNYYAQMLGLSPQCTFYDSPHGLMNKNNTSCAADVARLVCECMCGGLAPQSPSHKGRRKIDQENIYGDSPAPKTE